MQRRFSSFILALLLLHPAARLAAQEGSALPPAPTPTDIKPGSITCDECPYPYPAKYLDIRVYTQDVRISYMDVAPQGAANGRTVLLLHGNNFGGFYFTAIIVSGLAFVGLDLYTGSSTPGMLAGSSGVTPEPSPLAVKMPL